MAAGAAASARSLRSRVTVSATLITSVLKSLRGPHGAPISSPNPRIRRISRLPAELGALASMLPLHSVVASSRLVSVLAPTSQSWGRIPLGWFCGKVPCKNGT